MLEIGLNLNAQRPSFESRPKSKYDFLGTDVASSEERRADMSIKGIYSALSGSMAQNLRLETVANNLANVNTPGFKRDTQAFREYLTANEKPPSVIQVPKVPASIESFYDMQGGDKSYVESNGTFSDFTQGGLKSTGSNLDIAIEGKAFFEVATPRGVQFSRNGSLSIDGDGKIVTQEGWPLLKKAEPGTPMEERVIRITTQGALNIGNDGQVEVNNESLGQISLVDIADLQALKKEGSSVYSLKPNMNPQISPSQTSRIRQGFIESSNVNIVQEMTDMISATRLFESTQKAIQAYDSMAEKMVNVVPRSN